MEPPTTPPPPITTTTTNVEEPNEIRELNNNMLSLKRYYTGYRITNITPNEIEYDDPTNDLNQKTPGYTSHDEILLYNPTNNKPYPKQLVTFKNIKPIVINRGLFDDRRWTEEQKNTIKQFFVIKENQIREGDDKYNEVLEKLKEMRTKDETDANNTRFKEYSSLNKLKGDETKYIFHIITDLDNTSITYLDSTTSNLIKKPDNNNNDRVILFNIQTKQRTVYLFFKKNLTRQNIIDYMMNYYVVTSTSLTDEDKTKIARLKNANILETKGAKNIFAKNVPWWRFGGSKRQKSTKKHTYNKRKRQTKKHLKMNKRKSKKH